jgi:hypothetical protein
MGDSHATATNKMKQNSLKVFMSILFYNPDIWPAYWLGRQ